MRYSMNHASGISVISYEQTFSLKDTRTFSRNENVQNREFRWVYFLDRKHLVHNTNFFLTLSLAYL